jgi:hypothetical protein
MSHPSGTILRYDRRQAGDHQAAEEICGGLAMMRTANRPWILLGAVGCLSGCTTLVPHTSIEPYIKDKQKRNAIELIAETYCREKRLAPDSSQPEQVPDYIFTTDGCSRFLPVSHTNP